MTLGKEATLYQPLPGGRVRCTACARYCNIGKGQVGLCGIRGNTNGKLWLYVYGKMIAGHIDPIEKKPVSHYMPGTKIFSIATTGCNWLCHPVGTQILLANGQRRCIEDLLPGDSLWSYDVENGMRVTPDVVTHLGRHRARLWEVRYGSHGQGRLVITKEHPILTKKGWKTVEELRPRDEILRVWYQNTQARKRHGATSIDTAQFTCGKCDAQVMELVQKRDKIKDKVLQANGWDAVRISGTYLYNHPQVKTLIAEDLQQPVLRNKREWVTVKKATPTSRVEQVYSFECIPKHNYVADGIISHNCSYCQNFDISQRRKIEGLDVTPESVVEMTKRYRCEGLAYTYNEPSIFIEFAHDIGVQARREGLINIFVSNGYDTPETVALMRDFLDCITVDFKGNGETSFVRKYIGIANADPIFQTLLELRDKTNVHIEITDLIVPEVGDDLGAAKKLSSWVYDNLGPDTPIHFLRFHPDYKMMNLPSTPIKTLEKHHTVAKKVGLNYVYLGNVPGHPLEHTYCPECGKVVVERSGFDITGWHMDDQNRCKYCGNEIAIIGHLSKSINEERFIPIIR